MQHKAFQCVNGEMQKAKNRHEWKKRALQNLKTSFFFFPSKITHAKHHKLIS